MGTGRWGGCWRLFGELARTRPRGHRQVAAGQPDDVSHALLFELHVKLELDSM